MDALVNRERVTANPVARSQISVAVTQGEVSGTQADVRVNQVWDDVVASGSKIGKTLAKIPASCPSIADLQANGAEQALAQTWEAACVRAVEEKTKFNESYERAASARADLKAFQAVEQHQRQALVQQSTNAQ
jgi:hypothetical protein